MATANAKTTDYRDLADNVAHWVADKGESAVAEMLYAADLFDADHARANPVQAKAHRAAIEGAIADIYPDAPFRLAKAGDLTGGGTSSGGQRSDTLDAGSGGDDLGAGDSDVSNVSSGSGIPDVIDGGLTSKRPDEDIVQYMERRQRQSDRYVADHNAQRFDAGADNFAALVETTGITVTRDGERGARFDLEDGHVLDGVDSVGAARLADRLVEDPRLRDTITDVAAGRLDAAAIEAKLDALNNPQDRTTARQQARHGAQTSQRRARLEALHEIALAQEYGAEPEEIGDLLVAHFAPDPNSDLKLAAEIVAGLVPGLQQVQAADNLAFEVEALTVALEGGDLTGASQAGLFAFLAAVDGIPGAGKAAGLLRRGLRRATAALPGKAGALMRRNLAFGDWIAKVSGSGGKATRQAVPVGRMDDTVADFIRAKGYDPGDGQILIRDNEALHIMRDAKAKRGQAVPREHLERFPEHVDSPERVLWDSEDDALLYVFDVPSEGKKGKVVVRVGMKDRYRLEGESKRPGKRSAIFVRTAGIVEPRQLGHTRYVEVRR